MVMQWGQQGGACEGEGGNILSEVLTTGK